MTTQEFITKNFGVTSTKERKCSSVFADHNGNMYSYGYHYPLLFTLDGKVYRNVAGYSNTTAKHIGWCYGFDAIDVELDRLAVGAVGDAIRYDNEIEFAINEVKRCLKATVVAKQQAMDAKKRKDTQVYKWLEFDYSKAVKQLAKAV